MTTGDGRPRWTGWLAVLLVVLGVYLLSSGPVLATGFWLRETTGHDEFYCVMWLYFPLIILEKEGPTFGVVRWYIEWWVNAFGTVGPG